MVRSGITFLTLVTNVTIMGSISTINTCLPEGTVMIKFVQIHHVAYRCNDAKENVEFYTNMLQLKFLLTGFRLYHT